MIKSSANSKRGLEDDVESNEVRKNSNSVLDINHKDCPTPLVAINNNLAPEDFSRTLNASQKMSSILPPPPLLIRPTPVTQSRESILLNAEAKFWNHGIRIFKNP